MIRPNQERSNGSSETNKAELEYNNNIFYVCPQNANFPDIGMSPKIHFFLQLYTRNIPPIHYQLITVTSYVYQILYISKSTRYYECIFLISNWMYKQIVQNAINSNKQQRFEINATNIMTVLTPPAVAPGQKASIL